MFSVRPFSPLLFSESLIEGFRTRPRRQPSRKDGAGREGEKGLLSSLRVSTTVRLLTRNVGDEIMVSVTIGIGWTGCVSPFLVKTLVDCLDPKGLRKVSLVPSGKTQSKDPGPQSLVNPVVQDPIRLK